MDDNEQTDAETPSSNATVAQKLVSERERQGLTLKQVAERTRLSIRHLASLEEGKYSALPGTTYAIGFTRSYAKALDMDEQALIEQLRRELDYDSYHDSHFAGDDYEPANPGRIPPKFFTWGAIAVLLLLLVGYLVLSRMSNQPQIPITPEPTAVVTDGTVEPVEADAPDEGGPVVLTANEDVWMRIYERDGDKLFENLLAKGKSYTVPEDANEPLILTGRPQALDVSVGGRAVPVLGRADYTINDVAIDAESLLARDGDDAASSSSGTEASGG